MPYLLPSDYNYLLVIISVIIAVISAYTAIDLVGRINATIERARLFWLGSGAIAMGIGIWSMHFIGMLAFRLPVAVHYDIRIVVLSVLPAIVASGLALLVASSEFGWWKLFFSSVFMGGGIASMHYIGMAAIQSDISIQYDLKLLALSLIVAIAVSSIGLYLFFLLRDTEQESFIWKKITAAIVIGSAIPTMHYIGMSAACFMPGLNNNIEIGEPLQAPENTATIATGIILSTLIILSLTIVATFFDRRLSIQITNNQILKSSQEYLERILEGIQVGVMVVEDGKISLVNQAALNLLKLKKKSDFQTLLDQKDIPLDDHRKEIIEATKSNQEIHRKVFQMAGEANKDSTQALLININALGLTQESKTQLICTLNDVSDLKSTEQQLKQSKLKYQKIAQQEELFNQVSTQIRESLELNTILQTTVHTTRLYFKADRTVIYKFEEDFSGWVAVEDAEAHLPSTLGEATDECFPLEIIKQYQQGKTRYIENIHEVHLDPDHYAFLQRLNIQANLISPILVDTRLWGLLIVHQCDAPRQWQDSEKDLLARLAIQAGK